MNEKWSKVVAEARTDRWFQNGLKLLHRALKQAWKKRKQCRTPGIHPARSKETLLEANLALVESGLSAEGAESCSWALMVAAYVDVVLEGIRTSIMEKPNRRQTVEAYFVEIAAEHQAMLQLVLETTARCVRAEKGSSRSDEIARCCRTAELLLRSLAEFLVFLQSERDVVGAEEVGWGLAAVNQLLDLQSSRPGASEVLSSLEGLS